jgi:hypothetical protein
VAGAPLPRLDIADEEIRKSLEGAQLALQPARGIEAGSAR